MTNKNLSAAKKAKNDEFYTQLRDIENELVHYKDFFKDKVVYCNCDNPEWSNFPKFFYDKFKEYGLKGLITSHFEGSKPTYATKYYGGEVERLELEGNGGFRSPECIELLKECDVVVTNPPFSLFRSYIALMVEYDKKFLVIGNQNAIAYKEIFPLIKDNKLWLGHNKPKEFRMPDDCPVLGSSYVDNDGNKYAKSGNTIWLTNIDTQKRHEKLILYKHYNAEEYPKYDNYMAFNVNKVADIPCDDYIDIEIDPSELEKWKAAYPDLEIIEN